MGNNRRAYSSLGGGESVQAGDNRPAIVFDAAVYKVQTLIDGGIRLTLDLPEDAIPAMAALAEARREGIPLRVSCSARENPGY